MNDIYGLQASGLPPELAAKLSGLTRQQQIAEAMMKQGMAPVENSGGPGSRIHWTQGLAKIVNAYLGAKGMRDVNEGMAGLGQEAQAGKTAAFDAYQKMKTGTPEVPYNDTLGSEAPQAPVSPGMKADPRGAIAQALSNKYIQNSPLLKWDMDNLNRTENREDQQAFLKEQKQATLAQQEMLAKQAREQQMEVLKMRLEDQRLSREDRASLARELAKMRSESGGDKPFFTFLPTPQGIVSGNARTGKLALATLEDGSPVVKSADSPELQAQIAGAKEVAKDTGAANVKMHDSAIAAADNLQKIDGLINHLKTSDAITGMGAETLKNIERAKALVTASKAAGKKVSDTEIADVMMGSEVFPMIQALGIGARGMDTPAEREFMRNVLTGTISLNKDTLLRMAEIRRDVAKRTVDRFNERVNKGEMDDYFKASKRTKGAIAAPADMNVPTATSADGKTKLYLRNGQWVPQ